MSTPMQIDFVSDISCPWCVIGLGGLEEALRRLDGVVDAKINFEPFELNPGMAPEGEDIAEHVAKKYGSTPEQSAASREMIKDRAAQVGFRMNTGARTRIYNTFDAHRLLHWAKLQGKQKALKRALFEAYFTEGQNPSDHALLVDVAREVGLDPVKAREILASDLYAQDVRIAEQFWTNAGVTSVPAIVVDRKYLLSGGQPPEFFENALREIIKKSA